MRKFLAKYVRKFIGKFQSFEEQFMSGYGKITSGTPQKIVGKDGADIATVEKATQNSPYGFIKYRTYKPSKDSILGALNIVEVNKAVTPNGKYSINAVTADRQLLSFKQLRDHVKEFKQPPHIVIESRKPYDLPRGYNSICV